MIIFQYYYNNILVILYNMNLNNMFSQTGNIISNNIYKPINGYFF